MICGADLLFDLTALFIKRELIRAVGICRKEKNQLFCFDAWHHHCPLSLIEAVAVDDVGMFPDAIRARMTKDEVGKRHASDRLAGAGRICQQKKVRSSSSTAISGESVAPQITKAICLEQI